MLASAMRPYADSRPSTHETDSDMNMQRDPDIIVRTKNESRLAIAILAIAMGSVGVLPIFNAAAARTIGSSGLGFSCDVNTKQCSCTGTYDGADCTAMKANCDSKCDNDDGSKCYKIECNATGCSCKMARTEPPASAGGAPIRTGAGLCLDVHAPDASKNGGRVQVWACNGQPQQRWTYDRTARAVRVASGLCLDVHAPEVTTNGGRVQVWACNGAQQQQWTPLADGKLSNGGGLCLDVHAPDQSTNGGRVQVWACNGQQQQRFTSSVFKPNASSPAVDGFKSLISVSTEKASDASSAKVEPGDSVTITGNTARINRANGTIGSFACYCTGAGKCATTQNGDQLTCHKGDPGPCDSKCLLSTTTTGARPSEATQ
jgi:hypothetical protein